MDSLFQNPSDLPTPLNSRGGNSTGSGTFSIRRKLKRKENGTQELPQEPTKRGSSNPSENSVDRYFGSFSLESKRHVWDLLKKHPEYGDEGGLRLNRIRNNTSEVLRNDPIKTPINGGFTVYQHPENNESDTSGPGFLPE